MNIRRVCFGILLLSATFTHAREYFSYPQDYIAGIRTTIASLELRRHWLCTGIGVAIAFPLDQSIKSYAVENGLMPEPMARFGDSWGGGLGVVTILPGIYLADRVFGYAGQDTRQRLGFTFSSLLSVSIVTYILKPSIGRERPNGRGNLSFPSGHTSFTFGIAEVIRTLYGNRAGTLFYLMALNTGISRIHDNKHYLSDVIAGAGLGVGIVRGFHLAGSNTENRAAIRLLPAPGGVRLELVF
ncbi:phosphatase PAP2 family protein [Candidatus Neomarinimicrobiota bacterium]